MKKIISLIQFCMTSLLAFSQVPQKMSYQAVVRNSSNALVVNAPVGMQISILQGSASGTAVYVETQNPTTNDNGLVSIEIGNGAVVSGVFTSIDWANGPYFIKAETDPAGGSNYSIVGTSRLLSVPYAMYAETSGSSLPGPQGPTGPQGIPGNDGAVGPQGPIGLTGPQGPVGPQGIPGNDGNVGPQGPIGLQGPVGPSGLNGISGNTIITGNSNPSNGIGFDGDYFLDTNSYLLFGPKVNSTWPSGVSLIGPTGNQGGNGINGNSILHGIVNPNGLQGSDGDFYINTTNDSLFGPKSSGVWPNGISLIGPQGPIGLTGGYIQHFIGESYGGGIVFYVYDDGQHGLIASLNDQSTGVLWYNGVLKYTGSAGDGLEAGEMNTTFIVSSQISDNQAGSFAARLCADYSVVVNGINYGDWYLPSKEELNLLYLQKDVVGGFPNANYWSSTEHDSFDAWGQSFAGSAPQWHASKNSLQRVRAIRSF